MTNPKRRFVGEHRNQNESLPDKNGKPIYVGDYIFEFGRTYRVYGINQDYSGAYMKGALRVAPASISNPISRDMLWDRNGSKNAVKVVKP